MKIVVVYESMFGNTQIIAEGVGEGLRDAGEVRFGSVDAIAPEEARDADLIVAGGPTHAHGMARAGAHDALANDESYEKYGEILPGRESLRGWLDRLPQGRATVAAFDTRFDKPMWITGSAAKKIASQLERKGYVVMAAESFLVGSTNGPLLDGERERAVVWGRELAAKARSAITA